MITHPEHERCFYCATDAEFRQVRVGPNPTYLVIHMGSPLSACPKAAENFPDLIDTDREDSR